MIARLVSLLLLALLPLSSLAAGFTLKDLNGKTHTLDEYKGKWVLVNFWATWCPPCLDEIPDLVALHDKRKDKDLVVIGIAMDWQNPNQVKEFADNLFISYPVVLGDSKIAAQIGDVPGLPTTFLYDPTGKQAARNVGLIKREVIENYINGKKAKRK